MLVLLLEWNIYGACAGGVKSNLKEFLSVLFGFDLVFLTPK
jgi:hypothetical protein